MNGSPRNFFLLPFLSVLSGLAAGFSATLFLILLHFCTHIRLQNSFVIWFLPLGGLFIGWIYHHYGQDVAGGSNLILDEIHEPGKIISAKMAPFVLFSTCLTHLFGGSAGREGAAVQISASLADQIAAYFKLNSTERKVLLTAGMGAGFGAAIGAPWAGVIFGMEVLYIKRLKAFAVLECALASWVGYEVSFRLGAPHTSYFKILTPEISLGNLGWLFVTGIIFGLAAKSFIIATHSFEKSVNKGISYGPLRPAVGGFLVVLFYFLVGTNRYAGLGLDDIQNAMQGAGSFLQPLYKMIATILTVGSGFKGGEFVPLVYMGATLGSAMASFVPLSVTFLAGLGFSAVFGAASKTPFACAVMAAELFGYQMGAYALFVGLIAYVVSGSSTIYRAQRAR